MAIISVYLNIVNVVLRILARQTLEDGCLGRHVSGKCRDFPGIWVRWYRGAGSSSIERLWKSRGYQIGKVSGDSVLQQVELGRVRTQKVKVVLLSLDGPTDVPQCSHD